MLSSDGGAFGAQGREGHSPVVGVIPHSTSGSDIFPADVASGALASAGLRSFPPSPQEPHRIADATASVSSVTAPAVKGGNPADAASEEAQCGA